MSHSIYGVIQLPCDISLSFFAFLLILADNDVRYELHLIELCNFALPINFHIHLGIDARAIYYHSRGGGERYWRDYIKCLHIKRKAKCKTEKQTKGMSTAKQKWRADIARTSPRESNRFQAALSCHHVFSLIHQTRKTSNFTVCSTGSVFITKVAFPWGTSCLKTSVKLWDICLCKTHKT